jgi:hypothetical protein
VSDASQDDLYAAMDWLLAGQDCIQKKLAARHLGQDSLVLYDLSSSYIEGVCCPLAKLGYSRDGKRVTLQVNYGLLTDDRGCPGAISVHECNTSDSKTGIAPNVRSDMEGCRSCQHFPWNQITLFKRALALDRFGCARLGQGEVSCALQFPQCFVAATDLVASTCVVKVEVLT